VANGDRVQGKDCANVDESVKKQMNVREKEVGMMEGLLGSKEE
jgi:hypothetical protein